MTGATGPEHHRLTRECRAVLRTVEFAESADGAALRAHAETCAFCADWLRRRDAVRGLLRAPVAPPSELQSARLLIGIRERIVEQSEQGPIGRALEESMTVTPVEADDAWPEPLCESPLTSRLASSGAVVLGERDWRAVRAAVLERIAADTGSRERASRRIVVTGRRGLAAVGLAAALVLSVLFLREHEPVPATPKIVFADMSSMPSSPMAVIRRGGE